MEEIADDVSGAPIDLVERVLDEYGDPSHDEQDSTEDTDEPASAHNSFEPDMQPNENGRTDEDYSELSAKQLKTLRLIEENPGASQGELAETFDVTRATVNRWLNDIPGFDWARRTEIVAEILNGNDPSEQNRSGESEEKESEEGGSEEPKEAECKRCEELGRRVDAIEQRLDGLDRKDCTESAGFDPELAHKIVHACMHSERITEDEELQLLKDLLA